MARLQISHLSKNFGGNVDAVADLSFDVTDQEFVFLLGPSGAGKTTTLRMVAGLEQPSCGSIHLGDRNLAGMSPRERNVAMVYDKHSLYPHMSVFENMAYPLRLQRMAETEITAKISDVADTLQISELLERLPNQLSGGQQQRVAIGRALVRKANIYLMDEPISHLDAKLRAHMRVEFKKLQQEYSATILYVSHDQLEAMTMGDRIVVINEGCVQQIGTPREIFDRPANIFVAGFVGEPSMNISPCNLFQENGILSVRGQCFRVNVNEQWVNENNISVRADRKLKFGVRPHHLAIASSEDAGQPTVETGKIYAVETLGSETIFDIEVDNQIMRAWTRNAELGRAPRRIGDVVHYRIDPAAIYLFDAETGETLAHAGGPNGKAA